MIIGVAIKHNDIMICLPQPNRHHHCIRYAVGVLGITNTPIGAKPFSQGFYTETGVYLNRQEAFIYAQQHNQISGDTYHNRDLFSEDLW
jgi:pSer/pThr/pTyr-binding forkhead associated (FHA) protein